MAVKGAAPVRVLPESVANKIAAGEVVERPASVVKELVENALDARASRITVRVVGAGRRLIEVSDDGYGMSEQDALLAIERHATSKIRKADDLDNITTLGFRGEALASIAAVSRFELTTRRHQDTSATHIRIDGGIVREVAQTAGDAGTRIQVNRLYFNTPVRAKFLKGITTELSHCVDVVQRHALANERVGFQFFHNDKLLLDIPERACLRERIALIWGLAFVNDMMEIEGEEAGLRMRGFVGTPALTRSSRSHQFFFLNGRPIVNRPVQYGFEDGYAGLLTIGRHPVGVLLIDTHPRYVDVNIHPGKREVRFRDERATRQAIRSVVRQTLTRIEAVRPAQEANAPQATVAGSNLTAIEPLESRFRRTPTVPAETHFSAPLSGAVPETIRLLPAAGEPHAARAAGDLAGQTEFSLVRNGEHQVAPMAVYRSMDIVDSDALQIFDTYLLIPEEDRLLIIDQHALHERLNYDSLVQELADSDYAAQQLAVPIVFDVPPASAKLLESNLDLFSRLGIELEAFGGSSFQITAICHLYDESKIADVIYPILDELGQGNLFDREKFLADFLRLATEACRASVKAGDRLTEEEKRELIGGFHRMRPPYTCPHGRPIITELTLTQMEKSFRRRQ